MKPIFYSSLLFFVSVINAMESPVAAVEPKKPKYILPCLLPLSAAGSADGTALIVGSPQEIKIWNTREYQLQNTIAYEPGAVKMAANPIEVDQFAIVSSPGNPVSLWSIKDAQRTTQLGSIDKNNKINSVAINSAGTRLLAGNNDICENWDLAKQQKNIACPRAGTVIDAQWNPVAPNCFATCSVREGEQPLSIVFLWDQGKSDPVGECTLPLGVNAIRYNNQATQIICSSPGQYAVIELKKMALLEYLSIDGKQASKKPLDPAPGKTHNANSLLVPPATTDMFLAGVDDGNVIVADMANPAQSQHFQANANPDAIYGLVLNAHNQTLATTLMGAGFVKIWDASELTDHLDKRTKALTEAKKRRCNLL